MENKPTFRYNGVGVKNSSDTYRNIKGVHYSHHTSDRAEFDEVRKSAKENGLKTRIINGEIYVETKK